MLSSGYYSLINFIKKEYFQGLIQVFILLFTAELGGKKKNQSSGKFIAVHVRRLQRAVRSEMRQFAVFFLSFFFL